MKIAVTYEDNRVFQHFGRTEHFKVYDVEGQKVIHSAIMNTNGVGHGALAGLLAENNIDVLICGGLGKGAQLALDEAGIQWVAGAKGDPDEVIATYLRGELTSTQTTCDHHECHNH